MAQSDLTIENQSFPSFRADLNNALSALNSMQSGTSRPASAVAGTMWLDTTNATNPVIKFFDGTDDIQFATVNYSANTIDFSDSSLSTPITVTGSSSAGAEIRLPEDTDNGSHYVALKAPDSIASDLTLTLPSADGTNGQALITNGSGSLSFTTLSTTLTYSSGTATGDGSTTTATISSGRTVNDILVFVNGFQLTPTTDYTISGTTLTFQTAPANNAEITFRYLPLGGAYTHANFTGDGSATTITIDAGRAVDDILVVVNGLTLVPTDDYTISGTTLTFATAPANLAEITVRYLRLS